MTFFIDAFNVARLVQSGRQALLRKPPALIAQTAIDGLTGPLPISFDHVRLRF
jgi:hypothetical protein